MTKHSRFFLTVTPLLLSVVSAHAEIERVRSFFDALLSQPDSAVILDPAKLTGLLDKELHKASNAELATMIPVVLECLQSGRREIHTDAIVFLLAVRFRFDSAELLEPYVDYLDKLLGGSDEVDKRIAIGLLGDALLRPTSKELAVLAAHLNDERNTGEQFGMIGSALLSAFPKDSALIHKILASLKKYPNSHLESGFISDFGLLATVNEEALEFVRAGFQNPELREACLGAVERLPKEARARFLPELQRVIANPDETPKSQSAARRIIMQP